MVADALAPLGRVSVRRMFSGGGVFCEGVMFGIVVDDTLYLKGDEETAASFEREGCQRFTYSAKGKAVSLPYWRIPDRLLDDTEELADWARRSLRIALSKAAARAPAKAKAKAKRSARSVRMR